MMRFDAETSDISDCSNDQERALWLLQCPLMRLVLDQSYIRRWLQQVGFQAGLQYLDNELSILREPRRDDGHTFSYMAMTVGRGRLARVAAGLSPVAGDVP
jgi:hypothetical protein